MMDFLPRDSKVNIAKGTIRSMIGIIQRSLTNLQGK